MGLDRLAKDGGASPAGDPTLNVDPSRNGIEPDDAFTGPGDTVAWVVWYETGPSAIGLRANEQVFAAKIVADPAADGGFHWQAVGNGTATQTNVLDSSGREPVRRVRRVRPGRGRVLAQQGAGPGRGGSRGSPRGR